MKKIIKYTFAFLIFLNCNSAGQKFVYKNIPDSYINKVAVTAKERLSILNGLKDLFYIEKSLPVNYVQNGSVDYTAIVQAAIDKHRVVVFPNFPILINEKGLTVGSNSILYFPEKSKILLKSNTLPQYEVIRIHDVENVKVYFPNIQGDRYDHIDKSGEWGMGISIRGTKNILIYGAKVEKCWGDGIYLGISPVTNSAINNNVTIKKSFVNDNRRNGMSIISAQNLIVDNFLAANTYGTAPNAGIDIEPDHNTDIIRNLYFKDIVSYNNASHGFLFVLGNLYGKKNDIGKITLNNLKVINGDLGISFRIGSEKEMNFKPFGEIEINNIKFENLNKQEFFSYQENERNNFQVKIKTNDSKNLNRYKSFFNNSQKIMIIR